MPSVLSYGKSHHHRHVEATDGLFFIERATVCHAPGATTRTDKAQPPRAIIATLPVFTCNRPVTADVTELHTVVRDCYRQHVSRLAGAPKTRGFGRYAALQVRVHPRTGQRNKAEKAGTMSPFAASGAPLMSESAFAERIVHNLLDTDFYKLTMMQGVLHNYPDADVEWEFRCRNGEDLRPYLGEIRHQLEVLNDLTLDDGQLGFLERISFLKPDFLRFCGCFASTCAMCTSASSTISCSCASKALGCM